MNIRERNAIILRNISITPRDPGSPFRGPHGVRLECALGRFMTAGQLAQMDAAQARALAPVLTIDSWERDDSQAMHSGIDACEIVWAGIAEIDPYADLYIDIGGGD